MRILFILLLLANAALFGYATLLQSGSRDAHLVEQQLNADKIKLLTPREAGQLAAAAKRAEPPKMLACIEWGAFTPSDATRVEETLAPLALGAKLSQRKTEESAGYWVFIPPLASRQVANQKAGELKRLGVDDYFIVQDDPKYHLAISLGIFKTEEAAKNRLENLRKKGVRSAQVGERETPVSKVFFQMRDVPDAFSARLGDMKNSFPGSEVKACPAEDKKAAS